ncbi:MAG: hypothetical protein JWO91_1063 [Acidobacteriaceae bacterium]|nr:hypothetical protein [Acidobacteriaceae bacterium]
MTKNAGVYVLVFQSSAARSQVGELDSVQIRTGAYAGRMTEAH